MRLKSEFVSKRFDWFFAIALNTREKEALARCGRAESSARSGGRWLSNLKRQVSCGRESGGAGVKVV